MVPYIIHPHKNWYIPMTLTSMAAACVANLSLHQIREICQRIWSPTKWPQNIMCGVKNVTSEARWNITSQNLIIREYYFEVVKEILYLRSKLNFINNMDDEIYIKEFSLPIEHIMAYITCLYQDLYLEI